MINIFLINTFKQVYLSIYFAKVLALQPLRQNTSCLEWATLETAKSAKSSSLVTNLNASMLRKYGLEHLILQLRSKGPSGKDEILTC
jgi:hypothetical protein